MATRFVKRIARLPPTVALTLQAMERSSWMLPEIAEHDHHFLPFEPRPHQLAAVGISLQYPKFCFWWPMGAGKTIGMLLIQHYNPMKTLVVCPKSIMRTAWGGDASLFKGRIQHRIIWHNNVAQRRRLIKLPTDIGITNYDTFKRHQQEFIDAGFERLILDESSKIRNPKSQISQACVSFADQCRSAYLLSGEPIPNAPTDYYPQLRCMGPSAVHNHTFWTWCNLWFTKVEKPVPQKGGRIKWVLSHWEPKAAKADQFASHIAKYSHSVDKDSLGLPELMDRMIEFDMTSDEFGQYTMAQRQLRFQVDRDAHISVKSQALAIKLRQITGGNMYVDPSEVPPHLRGNVRTVRNRPDKHYLVLGDSKLKQLSEIIDWAPHDKMIFWAEFGCEIDRIQDLLVDRFGDQSVVVADGRTANVAESIDRFQKDNQVRYIIGHPATVGHGATLTASRYAVWYSTGYSWDLHAQSKARHHRLGQKHSCLAMYLIAKRTKDPEIIDALNGRKSASQTMMLLVRESEQQHGQE